MTFLNCNAAKRVVLTAIALLLLSSVGHSDTDTVTAAQSGAGVRWLVDMDEAKKKAASTGKPMLALFTGSDWCPTCARLHEEIVDHVEFAEYVNEAFVCVKIDVIADMRDGKIPNPYESVLKEYQVTAYPAVLVLDSDGKVVARKGGQDGGPVPYVTMLKKIVEGIGKGGGEFEWLVDMDQAKQRAAATGKPMLIVFSGSDWCGWCIKLEEEVFSRDEFKNYGKGAFVCVKIDVVSDMLNGTIPNPYEGVIKEYKVQGYPTVLITDQNGTVLASKGYQAGGPGPYVEMLANVLQEANIEVAAVQEDLGPFARSQERILQAKDTEIDGGEITLEMAVFLADWPPVRQLLSELPEGEREDTFTAITSGMKEAVSHSSADMGLFSLGDVFELAACVDTLTETQISTLGDILSVIADYADYEEAVKKEYLSADDGCFGDRDADQRDNTYHLLKAAGWTEAADEYLLAVDEAFECQDVKSLENRVVGLFEQVAVKHDDEKLKQALDITVRMRKECPDSAAAGEKGFLDVIDGLFRMNLESADQWLREFFQTNKEVSADFYTYIGGEAITKTKGVSPEVTRWLWLQDRVASQFLAHNQKITADQTEILNALATSWLQVAPKKTSNAPNPLKPGLRVTAELRKEYDAWRKMKTQEEAAAKRLLPILPKVAFHAPQGEWLRKIRPELAGNVFAARTRIYIQFGEPQKAVSNVIEHASLNEAEAFDQAKNLLFSWMKAMGREEGEPLTAAMQERAKQLLFGTLETFQKRFGRQFASRLVLDTFVGIHVSDELFKREDVDKLLEQVDDPDGQVVSDLAARMAVRLRRQWVEFSDARPNRAYRDLFAEVQRGYALFDELLAKSAEQHPDNWQLAACLGGLRLDAADFHLARHGDIPLESREKVLVEYESKRNAALEALQSATTKYAKAVSAQSGDADNIGLLALRFEAAMSIPELAAGSVLAGARDSELAALREDILAFEDRAEEDKLFRFVDWFTKTLDKRNTTEKYAYLAGAVKVQVGDRPNEPDHRTALEKRLYGYDEWLREVKLVTRLDGGKSVGVGQDFGVFIALQHSIPVGETSDLDHYLGNKAMVELFTDRLKDRLRDDFTFREIVFHESDAKEYTVDEEDDDAASEIETVVEKETPLAFLVLRAKNADVTEVPPIEIILPYPKEKEAPPARGAPRRTDTGPPAPNLPDFGNLSVYLPSSRSASINVEAGKDEQITPYQLIMAWSMPVKDRQGNAYKIAMSLLSEPIEIDAQEAGDKRPCRDIVVTQAFDERMVDKGRIRLNVTAEGIGLIPELEELLDIEREISGYRIKEISGPETKLVSLDTEDRLTASCNRTWYVELAIDGRHRDLARTFTFPAAKHDNVTQVTNMRYNYGKLEPCESTIDVGWIPMDVYTYFMAAVWTVLIIALLRFAYPYVKVYITKHSHSCKYHMPDHVSPFTVATLVRQIGEDSNIGLTDQQRREIHRDAEAIEEAYFQQTNGNGTNLDLKAIADRWIRTGKTMAGRN